MMTEIGILEAKPESEFRAPTLGGWSCVSTSPGSISHPSELSSSHEFLAPYPMTVASMYESAGGWSFEHPPEIDNRDWWYRTTFGKFSENSGTTHISFEGLATLADVWLNGIPILKSSNMFRTHVVDVTGLTAIENELAIRFRSVSSDLQSKRPRPRWKTNLVNHQQLRAIRTTLQGRIPGWSPPVPAIGPWRPVRLLTSPSLTDLHLCSNLDGEFGVVTLAARVLTPLEKVTGELRVGNVSAPLTVEPTPDGVEIRAELRIEKPDRWWPHTLGSPTLYRTEIHCLINGVEHNFPLDPVGFRILEVSQSEGYSLAINGEPIHCRGACWTVSNILSLSNTAEGLRRDLTLARDSGANMLRVCGTMVYESDDFYRLCDELGLMVWQDFMFANMDYPVDDPDFRAEIREEAVEQIKRLARHPSVVIYCGNSEIEQQAAMLGIHRDLWRNEWFGEELPGLCSAYHPGTAYLPSTPCGGTLPFATNRGVSHYYGVGAYLRPFSELRTADVKFSPECLGFSNIPEPEIIDEITSGRRAITHDPRWKARVPRDTGPGWDFEDVRDHYFREIFGLDPIQCRGRDPQRYLELSRTVPGEMMAQVFSEWRSNHSSNRGALVWFYKDLWPAAGWGIVDSSGRPKSTWYYLKRSWQPRQLTITDEGLNGLHVHLINETSSSASGRLEITLLKEPNQIIVRRDNAFELAPRSKSLLTADEIFGEFHDVSYAYRFGPAAHDIVVATWFAPDDQIVSQACHFIGLRNVHALHSAGVETSFRNLGDGAYEVRILSNRFLHSVRLAAKGYLPTDNYFHLPPDQERRIVFHSIGSSQAFRGEIEALNLHPMGIPVEPITD